MKASDLGFIVTHELINLIIGEKLGSGAYRDVYALGTDSTKVLKVERGHQSFSNVAEWDIWNNTFPNKWKRWFAPCYDISGCGTILIQARVKPVSSIPKMIPSFFTDLKLDNWGRYKGRIVCCDYGNHKFFSDGFWTAKLVKTGKVRE